MARRHEHSDGAADAGTEEELRQADLSHLRLQDMTPDERAELKRRYDDFVRHFVGAAAATKRAAAKKPRPRKWMPAAKG